MRILNACLLGGALMAGAFVGPAIAEDEITYTKDIAPLLRENCEECHRVGGVAPLALSSYRQAKGWAAMVREVVESRRMPPWHADPHVGTFRNDRRLSDEDIQTLVTWMETGYKRGNPEEALPPFDMPEGWRIKDPDVVLQMPEEVEIAATGVVPYMNIEIPTGFTEDRWIEAMDVQAGNAKVVHHILVYVRDPNHPGDDMGDFLKIGRGFLIGFAPGTVAVDLPKGMAYKIPAGSTLIFQMHYTPTGKPETDQSKIALRFADEAPEHELVTATTVNFEFEIPPHAESHRVEATSPFPKNAILYSMTPHMHYRGKSYEFIAHFPDGTTRKLLHVPNFDFNWQTTYILQEPVFIPAGTRMETIAHFDNSANNPYNPDPSKPIHWGDQTWEEMMIGWMNLSWFDGDADDFAETKEEMLRALEERDANQLARAE